MALRHHEGSLRASLRAVYGLDLRRVVEGRELSASDLADLVVWLPAGCAFWQDYGGPAALPVEVHELRKVSFWLRVLDFRERQGKGEKPKPEPTPPLAHERRAQAELNERKATAWLRRQKRQ